MEKEHGNRGQNNKTIETGGGLPFDMITWQILTRLPEKSLLRCRGVCRKWFFLIRHDKVFKEKCTNRATPDDLVQDDDDDEPNDSPNQDLIASALCGDLVLTHGHGEYCHLRNPVTRVTYDLPVPHGQHILRLVFHYDKWGGPHKLIFISKQGYELFTLGDDKWRPVEPNYRQGQCMMLSRDRKKMLFIYLVRTARGLDLEVACFDLRTERYFIIQNFPRGVFSALTKIIPFQWNRSLAVGELSRAKGLQVLVLEKKDKEENDDEYKWSEEIQQVCSAFFNLHLIDMDLVPIEVIHGNLWFHCHGNKKYKFCYDIEAGSVVEYQLGNISSHEYRPTLNTLRGNVNVAKDIK